MALTDATLAGKLAMAMYAADTEIKEWRVRRALGITHAGLRKLNQRLRSRGWLTTCTFWDNSYAIHKIHVPGLVAHPDRRHFVSEKSTADFAQKVAPMLSTVVPVDSVNTITIRAEILDLKGYIATDKFLLILYSQTPAASNEQVMVRLGLSRAGLKKARHRLLQTGVLTKTLCGYQIHVPGLVYIEAPDGGHYVSECAPKKTSKK